MSGLCSIHVLHILHTGKDRHSTPYTVHMESSLLASTATGRKRVIAELTRGRKFAQQLQALLRKSPETDVIDGCGMTSAQILVNKILDSYNRSLPNISTGESDVVSEVLGVDSLCLDGHQKSEDSDESCKTSVRKDRRGCYKRRRTSETCIKETSSWIDDGHAWRKYGQKSILNSPHPRNYFRCTHKYDQGCPATKHVQKIQEDPPKFRTTYYDDHTCNNPYKSSQAIIMDPTAGDTSSKIIWSFESQIEPDYKPNDPVKQKNNEQVQDLPNIISGSSDYFISPCHLTTFDQTSCPVTAFSSGSDHGDVISSDVYSCTASTHSIDVDCMIVGLDDFLEYD
ncbi:probable WRKY transcription factor 53 [Olea europaea var. sylvestris]|nr:probable WRKY transcription factor 53 [Olea europaea var. sylvestris]